MNCLKISPPNAVTVGAAPPMFHARSQVPFGRTTPTITHPSFPAGRGRRGCPNGRARSLSFGRYGGLELAQFKTGVVRRCGIVELWWA